MLKFVSFLKKNNDIPFVVKRRVFDAALMSSILYGCESWINADLRPMIKLYNWAIKELLGVRITTCNDLCYLEIGYPPLKDLVLAKQRKFFQRMWTDRSNMTDDPLVHAIRIVRNSQFRTGKYITGLIDDNMDDVMMAREMIKSNVRESGSSKRCFYRMLNPELEVHEVYKTKELINEYHRVSFTRFRLSAHSLAIETGRWKSQGRRALPPKERVCICGGDVQTERHVVEDCHLTQGVRLKYQFTTLHHLFSGFLDNKDICQAIHDILCVFR